MARVPHRRNITISCSCNIVGASTIARLLGVVPSAVSNWQQRGVGFPEPIFQDGGRKFWDWADVIAWWAAKVKG